ncbi:MAG: zinc ribbon domain-containing protein [Saprospiraceae bacterium]|nr:zinc ribbon domain-containing protein [Saprospiraceae bacterium]MCB9322393.1 zinc ribbon domain-containing protein [Lewinellaceae bacterium]
MLTCNTCKTVLPAEARFCFNCGTPVKVTEKKQEEPLVLDPHGNVTLQINELFFKHLKVLLQQEQDEKLFQSYSERVYQCGYRDIIQRRAEGLAEKITRPGFRLADLNEMVFDLIDELLDFFIIRFCGDLNVVSMPEAILKYHKKGIHFAELFQMTLDYLNFDSEEETVYTDFLKMPVEKLKTAGRSFLFPEPKEKILFICDLSLLGSCREGFAMTEKAIYWKHPMQKAKKVFYNDLEEINRTEDWITINGHFFNVSPSLNIRVLKLLKKLHKLN